MDDKYNIQVLERAFSVMDALLDAGHPLSFEAIMSRTGMVKSTAFRILSNLIRHGYVTETDDGYWLGLKLISFGQSVERSLDIRQTAAPFLTQLRDQTNETCYLATLTHDWSVLYLDKCESRQPVGVMLHSPGMTIETYCTGLGKTLLAYRPDDDVRRWLGTQSLTPRTPNTLTTPDTFLTELDAIRQRGYGIDNGERSLSIRCIAAPVRNARGDVIAAISVAGPTERMPNPLIGSEIASLALDTAHQISAALGMPNIKPDAEPDAEPDAHTRSFAQPNGHHESIRR